MLFGTYQPLFRANCNKTFENLKNQVSEAISLGATDENYKGTVPEPLEEVCGFRPIWCFPARDFREAFAHSLLTAPNTADLFFLIESDNFIRLDKVKHYAEISRDADQIDTVRNSICPDCPDDRSEFLLPVESLETAKLMAFVPSAADPTLGTTVMPFCFAQPDGTYMGCGIPEDLYMAFPHLIAPMRTLLDHMGPNASAMERAGVGKDEMYETMVREPMRLKFMFFVLPVLYELISSSSGQITGGPLFLIQHTGRHLLDCYNAMARWSHGGCQKEGYEAIFQDVWEHIITSEPFTDFLTGHGFQLPERSEPCPCGSGKKFKKCHGKILM